MNDCNRHRLGHRELFSIHWRRIAHCREHRGKIKFDVDRRPGYRYVLTGQTFPTAALR